MTYDQWVDKFKPKQNTIEKDAPFDGTMFETYGQELEVVKQHAVARHVWTLLDAGGKLHICPGLHFVNRMGYFVTEVPYGPTDKDYYQSIIV